MEIYYGYNIRGSFRVQVSYNVLHGLGIYESNSWHDLKMYINVFMNSPQRLKWVLLWMRWKGYIEIEVTVHKLSPTFDFKKNHLRGAITEKGRAYLAALEDRRRRQKTRTTSDITVIQKYVAAPIKKAWAGSSGRWIKTLINSVIVRIVGGAIIAGLGLLYAKITGLL